MMTEINQHTQKGISILQAKIIIKAVVFLILGTIAMALLLKKQ
ncbi:MAG: hypothetical protein WDZ35_13955 [Crocinitomicaceae bacterium]